MAHIWFITAILGKAKTQLFQEFLPRSLSPYGDGLENAQIFQIPFKDPLSTMVLTFAANVTLGCNPTNVTMYMECCCFFVVFLFFSKMCYFLIL